MLITQRMIIHRYRNPTTLTININMMRRHRRTIINTNTRTSRIRTPTRIQPAIQRITSHTPRTNRVIHQQLRLTRSLNRTPLSIIITHSQPNRRNLQLFTSNTNQVRNHLIRISTSLTTGNQIKQHHTNHRISTQPQRTIAINIINQRRRTISRQTHNRMPLQLTINTMKRRSHMMRINTIQPNSTMTRISQNTKTQHISMLPITKAQANQYQPNNVKPTSKLRRQPNRTSQTRTISITQLRRPRTSTHIHSITRHQTNLSTQQHPRTRRIIQQQRNHRQVTNQYNHNLIIPTGLTSQNRHHNALLINRQRRQASLNHTLKSPNRTQTMSIIRTLRLHTSQNLTTTTSMTSRTRPIRRFVRHSNRRVNVNHEHKLHARPMPRTPNTRHNINVSLIIRSSHRIMTTNLHTNTASRNTQINTNRTYHHNSQMPNIHTQRPQVTVSPIQSLTSPNHNRIQYIPRRRAKPNLHRHRKIPNTRIPRTNLRTRQHSSTRLNLSRPRNLRRHITPRLSRHHTQVTTGNLTNNTVTPHNSTTVPKKVIRSRIGQHHQQIPQKQNHNRHHHNQLTQRIRRSRMPTAHPSQLHNRKTSHSTLILTTTSNAMINLLSRMISTSQQAHRLRQHTRTRRSISVNIHVHNRRRQTINNNNISSMQDHRHTKQRISTNHGTKNRSSQHLHYNRHKRTRTSRHNNSKSRTTYIRRHSPEHTTYSEHSQ